MTNSEHDSNILSAIGPLCDAGFALHWLKVRSKAPAGGGQWQDAPVATIDALRRTHFRGANLGVRLGEHSAVEGGYLHVIDLDIRLPDLADEAWTAFESLFSGIKPTFFPSVISGSGGESRHLYFVTDKPFFGRKLAVSEGKHRRHDAAQGKDVWSYDWEIDLFGTGRQVAMPPSIHPTSGLPYIWERPFDLDELSLGLGPIIDSDLIESLGVAETTKFAFESREPLEFKPGLLEADLDVLPVSIWDDRESWIIVGQALHHQFGGSDEGFELWAKYSAKSTKCDKNFRKANLRRWRGFGKNRRQPVTMGTVRQWAQDQRARFLADEFDDLEDDFQDDPEPSETRGNAGLEGDFQDASGDDFGSLVGSKTASDDDWDGGPIKEEEKSELPWTSLLALNKDGDAWVANLHNIELIVSNDPRLIGLPQLNEFTQETVQRNAPGIKKKRRATQPKEVRQLNGRVWDVKDPLNGDLWSDDRDFAIRSIIEAPKSQGGYNLKVSDRDLKAAVVLAANRNSFHPVREYLNGLTWDGVARVDRLWIDYVKATDDQYHRDVARLMMIAAVTRIFEPGHKFDFATILEGLQGKRKSTLIGVLGKRWFNELDGDFHDQKQMIELMQGSWIMEIPELTGFSRADVRSIKAFISRQKDRARLAYARRAGEFPRQCIFIGSTNDREYLKDDTGGRRFWPVECKLRVHDEIDTDRLEENVDQLWAEAVTLYRQMRAEKPRGTLPLYLSNAEARSTAERLQESRRQESPDDVLAGRIAEWLEAPIISGSIDDDLTEDGQPRYRNETCTAEIWVECLGKDLSAFKFQEQGSVNRALSKVPGWAAAGSKRFDRYGKQRYFARGGMEGVIARSAIGDLV